MTTATAVAAPAPNPGPGNQWLPLREVARRLDICEQSAARVLRRAKVKVRAYPGMAARFCRDDVDRIIGESTREL